MATHFEAQTQQEVFTEAELEEMQVQKRRQEGTPCTKENFEAWKVKFEAEMAALKAAEAASNGTANNDAGKGGGGKVVD